MGSFPLLFGLFGLFGFSIVGLIIFAQNKYRAVKPVCDRDAVVCALRAIFVTKVIPF